MKLSLRNGNLDDNTDNLNNLNNQDNQDNQGNQGDAETRSAKAVQQGGETNLTVYPNPTDDILYVELSGAGVQSAGLYDLHTGHNRNIVPEIRSFWRVPVARDGHGGARISSENREEITVNGVCRGFAPTVSPEINETTIHQKVEL